MRMYRYNLLVADQGISVTTYERFPYYRYFHRASSPNLELILTGGGPYEVECETPNTKLINLFIYGNFYFRYLLSYLAGVNSTKFNSVHGAGILVKTGRFKRKGVLLVGPGGTRQKYYK